MRGGTIEVAGSRVRVIEDGAGETAVLLVHGLGGWAENWAEVVPHIVASGRRAIAFDLPGFGASTAVRKAAYFDEARPFYAEVVEGVRRALALDRPHLVGHSLGGGIAAVTAVTHPHAYRSLTLAAPGGFGTELALFLRLMAVPLLVPLARLIRTPRLARDVLRSCFDDPTRIPEHLWRELDDHQHTYPESLRVMRAVATLRGVRRRLHDRWSGRARAYAGPVLALWGREDAIVSATHAAAVRAVFPQAEVRFIEHAGHLVMAERPDEFAAALLPFLDRAEGDARTMVGGVADHGR